MKRPYIARGLTQQGRQRDGMRALPADPEQPGMRWAVLILLAYALATLRDTFVEFAHRHPVLTGFVCTLALVFGVGVLGWAIGVLCFVSTLCNP